MRSTLSEPQQRALVILHRHGPLDVGGFIGHMWPDTTGHGLHGRTGSFLGALFRDGLVSYDGKQYGLTDAAHILLARLRWQLVKRVDGYGQH